MEGLKRIITLVLLVRELCDFVSGMLPNVIKNDRKVLDGRELDVYIPEKNIAIEYNGLYWHSHNVLLDKNYHYDKWRDCRDKGIQLITVWEDDWREKRTVVEKMLKHKLGFNEVSIGARKCCVKKVSVEDCKNFLNDNHIQGYVSGSIRVGLFSRDNDDLVAVMVLRREGNGVLNLVRYATSCSVVGGHSKILSWVDKNVEYSEMITFADHEVSDGGLYVGSGWLKVAEIPVDYKYVDSGRRVHKFNFRKSRFAVKGLVFDENMSERELADANMLLKIWDCGKTKFKRLRK